MDNRFGIGAGVLFGYLEEAMLLPDHHDWISHVGDKVRLSSRSVWRILSHEWVRHNLAQAKGESIIEAIKVKLN